MAEREIRWIHTRLVSEKGVVTSHLVELSQLDEPVAVRIVMNDQSMLDSWRLQPVINRAGVSYSRLKQDGQKILFLPKKIITPSSDTIEELVKKRQVKETAGKIKLSVVGNKATLACIFERSNCKFELDKEGNVYLAADFLGC
ncbi:MAG TPA: hypothetical protein P5299_01145 [Candidatus Woesebacteria bacterium]|nr:hypothetical protein [Candidatus Woesebacteria bacterium]